MILADLTSPLMKPRIRMLKDLPYKKYILHNANNIILNSKQKSGLEDFIILEHRQINSVRLRYLYSFFYTLFLLLRLNPKLIVVHWSSRLYQIENDKIKPIIWGVEGLFLCRIPTQNCKNHLRTNKRSFSKIARFYIMDIMLCCLRMRQICQCVQIKYNKCAPSLLFWRKMSIYFQSERLLFANSKGGF